MLCYLPSLDNDDLTYVCILVAENINRACKSQVTIGLLCNMAVDSNVLFPVVLILQLFLYSSITQLSCELLSLEKIKRLKLLLCLFVFVFWYLVYRIDLVYTCYISQSGHVNTKSFCCDTN